MSFSPERIDYFDSWKRVLAQLRQAKEFSDIINVHIGIIEDAIADLHKYDKFAVAAAAIALPGGDIRPAIGPRDIVESVKPQLSLRELPEPFRLNTELVVAIANDDDLKAERAAGEIDEWLNSAGDDSIENQRIVDLMHAAWAIGMQMKFQSQHNLKSKFSMN